MTEWDVQIFECVQQSSKDFTLSLGKAKMSIVCMEVWTRYKGKHSSGVCRDAKEKHRLTGDWMEKYGE